MGRGVVALLSALGTLVVCFISIVFVLNKLSKDLDKRIADNGGYDSFTEEELREIYEEIGERLQDDTDIVVALSEDGMAYWVDDSGLMQAPVGDDGEVDFDKAVRYNAFEATRSELTKVLLILDAIKEKK